MTDFLDNLTGGFYKHKKEEAEHKLQNSFSFFIQFDNDTPIEMYNNIDNNNSIIFEISNTNDDKSYLEYKCHKTGKKFKMFALGKNNI